MGLVIFIVFLGIYFIPFILSLVFNLEDNKKSEVFLLNLFLAWTIIGWVGILIYVIIIGDKQTHTQKLRNTKLDNIYKLFDLYDKGEIDLSMEDERGVVIFTKYANNPEMLLQANTQILDLLNNIYLEYQRQLSLIQDKDLDIKLIQQRFNERKAKRC